MRVTRITAIAGALLGNAALVTPLECLIECVKPSQHDPNAIPTDCNCLKEYCPFPQGPGGPEIPAGDIWAFNATADACGPVPDPEAECVSRDVDCVPGYMYGWSENDSACECLAPTYNKRQIICDIVCERPRAYDSHAIPVHCNCDERICPPGPECPAGTSFGWDQEADACGCVVSPEIECAEVDITCVVGYFYGWDAADSTCKCLSS